MPGIAIPSGDLWSFNAALIEFVDGRLGLKGLWDERDNFDGAVIDSSLWSTSVNSGGTATLRPFVEGVLLASATNANAAMLISKANFDFTTEWRIQAGIAPDPSDAANTDSFFLFRSATQPTTMSNAALAADRIINAGGSGANYITNGGSLRFLNSGGTWQSGATDVGFIIGKVVLRNFDSGTISWQLLLYDNFGVLQLTSPLVAWSATRTPGGGESLWFWSGSARTNASVDSNYILDWIRYNEPDGINYSQASPTATSPWFAIDQNTLDAVTAILLQLILEGTSTIKFQWALNNGAFNGSFLTPAQLLAALVGQSITDHTNSMRLMAQFNSNGDDLPRILLPQTKAEASGVSGGSQAAIEDVRLGTVYNDGNLTGTAAIPAKSDTRLDTPVDDGVGTLAVAPPSDVRLNVLTDDTVGNYVPAIEANHALGDSYGSNNTEFTGTKALTPFKLPVEVILEDSEILVFEGSE